MLRQRRTPIAAACGFDAVYIDLEYNPTSLETAARVCVAVLGMKITPIARVTSHDPHVRSKKTRGLLWIVPTPIVQLGCARVTSDGLEGGTHPLVRVLPGNAHLSRQVGGTDMQHIDAVNRYERTSVFDRLGCLD